MQEAPREVFVEELERRMPEFALFLKDCVEAGANINFVLPFSKDQAAAFWRGKVLEFLRVGRRRLWIIERDGRIAGSVQMDLDMPPNQAHRAEVAKLIVAPWAKRQGLARLLMHTLEQEAVKEGRRLLTLDTVTGGPAEPLYLSLGFQAAGSIPDFCLTPDGRGLAATTYMFKQL